MPRLSCGSLRRHVPHDWPGRGYVSYDLVTAELYHCGGHYPPQWTCSRPQVREHRKAAGL